MFAIFKTGGKQYSVKAGQILKVEKLSGNKGDDVSFDKVLALTDSSKQTIGSPLVKGAVIKAKIIDQIRDKKIIVFKKRKRQNYRHTQGHRQFLTVLKIESILLGNQTSSNVKKNENGNSTKKKVKQTSTKPKKSVVKKNPIKKKITKKKTTKE